jgi:hypothetical protein
MKRLILLYAFVGCYLAVSGQVSSDESQVKEVIVKLFEGMHNTDSALVRKVFTDDLTMATIYRNRTTGLQAIQRKGTLKDLLNSVGTKGSEPVTEEIWNLKIQVDADFAQAWCDYAFYMGNRFSHCGVDAFHLFKTADGWRIFHIADTRRREGCTIPEEIQNKYK